VGEHLGQEGRFKLLGATAQQRRIVRVRRFAS
jgi:hypothetical protein